MKNVFIFLAGAITGIFLLSIINIKIPNGSPSVERPSKKEAPALPKNDDGITLFDEPDECVSTSRFEVIRVLESGHALAEEHEQLYKDVFGRTNLVVLLLNDSSKNYYDHQIIKTPKGKCFKQVGIYKYTAGYKNTKTVPIVSLLNK